MKTQEELNSELETLKAKHGTVYTLTVPLDEEGKETATLFLKKADRVCVAMVSKMVGVDTNKALEAGLKNTYIGGDDLSIVLKNDDAFLSCESGLVEVMKKQQAVLKKN